MFSRRCAIAGCSKMVVLGEMQCSAHFNREAAPTAAAAPSPLDDVSREASADAQDGLSTSRRKGSSAFAKSVPRRSSIVDAEVRRWGGLLRDNESYYSAVHARGSPCGTPSCSNEVSQEAVTFSRGR